MCTQITTAIHSLFHQRLHKNSQEVVLIIILPTVTRCSLEMTQDVSGSLHGDETHGPYLARTEVHEAEKLSTWSIAVGPRTKTQIFSWEAIERMFVKIDQMTQKSMRTLKKKRTKELEIRTESTMPLQSGKKFGRKTLKHLQATEQLCLDGSNANGL